MAGQEPYLYELVIYLPEHAVPVVIGTRGKNIQSIKNHSDIYDAFVTAKTDTKPFQRVYVRGHALKAINDAAYKIQNWIQTGTNNYLKESNLDQNLPMLHFDIRHTRSHSS